MAERNDKLWEEKETGRLEAFSDGVFAFAITLLVLGLHDPTQGSSVGLLTGLIQEWPMFFAFFTSFITVLIMWVNHHNMFNFVRRIDIRFMFLNGILLLWVTLTPFTTSLVANHIDAADASTAAAVYAGAFLLLAVSWNFVWKYASTGHRLLASHVTMENVGGVNHDYNLGMAGYVVAFALAFVNGLASVVAILALAAYFVYTPLRRESLRKKNELA